MATIRPFKGIRPDPSYASRVAALPYDVMNSDEAREMSKDNPYSFLHIDKPEIDLSRDIDPHDPRVYAKANENLERMITDGIFIQDQNPCLYIYRLSAYSRTQTGLGVCTSIDEYLGSDGNPSQKNVIKKHELTREDKEQDRINHVNACNANTGPIFMTCRTPVGIREKLSQWTADHAPVYDFEAEDGVTHQMWVIDDAQTIEALCRGFADVPSLYIADGHHRNASAAKVALARRNGDDNPNAEHNYYLSVIFPDDELHIMDYNRVVKDLNGHDKASFLDEVSRVFDIAEHPAGPYKPHTPHTFGMYLDKNWYALTIKPEYLSDDPVEGLDVSLLQKQLLTPVLGIGDVRTDSRIDFVGGIRGLRELERRVDSGDMRVAFSMYPTSIGQLMAVADHDRLMPPKSTWFEPKLRSGLLIHSLA